MGRKTTKIPKRIVEVNEFGFKKKVRITKTDTIDATVMTDQGHSAGVIAARLGLSEHQVEKIRDKRIVLKNHADIVKDALGDYWYTLADSALGLITPEKLGRLSAAQLVTLAATATDKARLLEGKPTEIVAAYEEVIKKFILVDETVRKQHEEKNHSDSISVPFSIIQRDEFIPSSSPICDSPGHPEEGAEDTTNSKGNSTTNNIP